MADHLRARVVRANGASLDEAVAALRDRYAQLVRGENAPAVDAIGQHALFVASYGDTSATKRLIDLNVTELRFTYEAPPEVVDPPEQYRGPRPVFCSPWLEVEDIVREYAPQRWDPAHRDTVVVEHGLVYYSNQYVVRAWQAQVRAALLAAAAEVHAECKAGTNDMYNQWGAALARELPRRPRGGDTAIVTLAGDSGDEFDAGLFPPCVAAAVQRLRDGGHVQDDDRTTVGWFLRRIGVSESAARRFLLPLWTGGDGGRHMSGCVKSWWQQNRRYPVHCTKISKAGGCPSMNSPEIEDLAAAQRGCRIHCVTQHGASKRIVNGGRWDPWRYYAEAKKAKAATEPAASATGVE